MVTVLVVEDSRTQREIISGFLQQKGLQVTVACDGIEALEKIETVRPDLVLMDIIMPRMNGYECCRRLKSNPKTQNVPVIMCSSKREDFDRYWGLKQGADAYISKPFPPGELILLLKQLLGRSLAANHAKVAV
jgi:twitching motility two-component system response regulator PilH